MNNRHHCPKCSLKYEEGNPAMKLIDCEHSICSKCLPVEILCPIDKKRIGLRKHKQESFRIDQALMSEIQPQKEEKKINSKAISPKIQQQKASTPSLQKQKSKKVIPQIQPAIETPVKKEEIIIKKISPEKKVEVREQEVCLLHNKSADLICFECGNLICSSCAIFGEHKGHTILNCDELIHKLSNIAEQVLNNYQQLKHNQENFNQAVLKDLIEEKFRDKRILQLKAIKSNCKKMIEAIQKVEKAVTSNMDLLFKQKKEELSNEVLLNQIKNKQFQFYAQVEELGGIIDDIYSLKNIEKGLEYLSENTEKGYIKQRGEYLLLEVESLQKLIRTKIGTEVDQLGFIWNLGLQKEIAEDFCKLKPTDLELVNKIKPPFDGKGSQGGSNKTSTKSGQNQKLPKEKLSMIPQAATPSVPKADDLLIGGSDSKESSSSKKIKIHTVNVSPILPITSKFQPNYDVRSYNSVHIDDQSLLKPASFIDIRLISSTVESSQKKMKQNYSNKNIKGSATAKRKLGNESTKKTNDLSRSRGRQTHKSINKSMNQSNVTEKELINALNPKIDNKKKKVFPTKTLK